MPLGSLQKGAFDIVGVSVEVKQNTSGGSGSRISSSSSDLEHNHHQGRAADWILRLERPSEGFSFEMAAGSREEVLDWAATIRETGQHASQREDENRKRERAMRVARELSNLVVYCSSVVFQLEKCQRRELRNCREMSSFPETKAERLMLPSPSSSSTSVPAASATSSPSQSSSSLLAAAAAAASSSLAVVPVSNPAEMFLWYHEVQLSRVYPKAQRVDSSNYNPIPMWNVGSQMAALNFQTGDKPMQLNCAKFLQNGNCGYVLRPDFMFGPGSKPETLLEAQPPQPLLLGVRVLAARHLTRKSGRGMVSPNVEVEICGADCDNAKYRTKTIADNGFNPVWDEFFDFNIQNPSLAIFRWV